MPGAAIRFSALTALTLSLAPAAWAGDLTLDGLTEQKAADLLWQKSPDLLQAQGQLGAAEGAYWQSRLLPNPALDFNWGTIPVGTTTPPGLLHPLSQVPNYTVGLSELVELGKRGPRQRAAKAALGATAYALYAQLRERTRDLLDAASEVATAQRELATLEELKDDAAELTRLERERVARGDSSGLNLDRALLEEQKLAQQATAMRERLARALRECGAVAGEACQPFPSPERAAAFLAAQALLGPERVEASERPEVKSLAAQEESAHAQKTLADRQAIPDPTVRAGYLRDQFVISGNQRNSFFIGVSLPIPVFDHGQAQAHAASAQAKALGEARRQLVGQVERERLRLADERDKLDARRTELNEKTLPVARELVLRLEQAVKSGGAPLQDLLLARRSLRELLLDQAEVDLRDAQLAHAQRLSSSVPPTAPFELSSAF